MKRLAPSLTPGATPRDAKPSLTPESASTNVLLKQLIETDIE